MPITIVRLRASPRGYGSRGSGKTQNCVIPGHPACRGISLSRGLNRREIPRFARNDKINHFFRSLFSRGTGNRAQNEPRNIKTPRILLLTQSFCKLCARPQGLYIGKMTNRAQDAATRADLAWQGSVRAGVGSIELKLKISGGG